MDQSWKYIRDHFTPAPVVDLILAGFSLQLMVDTGFAGGIVIPFPLFQSLGLLTALTPDSYDAVMPDSRRVRLYTARAEVSFGTAKKFSVEVHSPFLRKKTPGSMFLRSYIAILDGKKEELDFGASGKPHVLQPWDESETSLLNKNPKDPPMTLMLRAYKFRAYPNPKQITEML